MPGGGQGERPGLTLQQRYVEGLLKTLQTTGNRRLGNTEIFRGLVKRGELHGGQQCVNVVDAHSVLKAWPIRAILLAILNLGSAQNPHVLRVRSGSSALAVFKLSTPMTLDG